MLRERLLAATPWGYCFGGGAAAVRELVTRPWDRVFERSRKTDGLKFGLIHPVPGRKIRDPRLLSHAQGCFLGQLVGDALGAQVEFRSGSSIRLEYPTGVRDLANGGPSDTTIAGQPTDDSEMALMLARNLAREERYDAVAVFDAYLHWWDSVPFDYGETTSAALGAAATVDNPEDRLESIARSARHSSQSNGSLMRISPLGIFGWEQPESLAVWARRDRGLTHPNPVCRESCAVFVRAIGAALGRGDTRSCYQAALEETRKGGDTRVIAALQAAETSLPEEMDSGRSQGWGLVALQNAFYRLLHAESFEEALVKTLACGVDADTNAAICGALLGAVRGRDAIPARWRRVVLTCRPIRETGARHPRSVDFWPVDALDLSEALLLVQTTKAPRAYQSQLSSSGPN